MEEKGILKKSYENDKYILEIEYEVTKTDSNNYFKEITWGAFFTNNSEADITVKSDTISCKRFGVNYYDGLNSSMSRIFKAGERTAIYRNALIGTTKYTDKVNFDIYGNASPSIDYIISIGRKIDGVFYDSFRLNEAIFLEPFDKIITARLSTGSANIGGTIHIITTNKPKCSCELALKLNGLTETIPIGEAASENLTVTRWKIPDSFASVIQTSSKMGVAALECKTYDTKSKILIGSKSYLLTLHVPDSDKPSVSTEISAKSEVTGTDLKNVYLAGFTHFEITSTVTPKNDASIQSINTTVYGQTYPGETSLVETDISKYTVNTVITNTIPKTANGNISITVKATDSRGLTNESRSYVEITPYKIPKISSFAVHRCLRNGTLDDEGDCCLVEYTFAVDALEENSVKRNYITNAFVTVLKSDSKNPIAEYPINCSGKQNFGGSTIIPELDTEKCFNIIITLYDRVTYVYEAMPLSTAFTFFDVYKDGTGGAFGKAAEYPDLIEFDLPVQFNKNFFPTMEWVQENMITAIDSYLGYDGYDDVIGLQVDYENKKFTRLAGAVGLNAGTDFNKFNMYGGRKRCAVAKDGTIKAFYGDADYNDSGSSADGQIMVYQPKFYYKVVPLKMDKITDGSGYHIRKANYYVTDKALAGFKLHPAFYDEKGNEVDYILYSAYEGCYWDSSMQTYFKDGTMDDAEIDFARDSINSISGKKPISGAIKNLTTTNLELLAQNLGHGWHLETIKTLSANQLLMMIELGTMNVQTAIGKGIAAFSSNAEFNASSLTGSTKSLGNITGVAASTKNEIGGVEKSYNEEGKVAVSYRGMENPWGNIYKFINGINIWGDGTMLGGQPYIADDFEFNAVKNSDNYKPVGYTLPNGAGYISAMGYGSEKFDWLFMPSEIKGNSSLPVGDYAAAAVDADGYRTVAHGGACYNNLAAGIFDCYCAALANGKGRTFGGRIIYIPTAE